MLEGFLISIPGLTTLLIAFIAWQMWRRRSLRQRAERNGACKLCGTAFAEAHVEFVGLVTRAERAKLDRFQSRFASFKIVCHECGAVNVCTSDGIAFTAGVPRED